MDMIDAYIAHLEETSESRSEATPEDRRKILRKLDRDLPFGIDRTSTDELREWLEAPNARTGEPRAVGTKATYLKCLRSAFGFWANPADPWISEDPTIGIPSYRPPKGRARPGTEEQLAHIIEHGKEPYRLWTIIAAYQALRAIELAGLDLEHITQRQLVVVRGKGGRPRTQDTDPLVWDAVRDRPPGPICRRIRDGRRADRHYITAMTSRYYQEELGFEGLTIHMWRHRLGVQAQRLYRDIRVTQELLGHASLSSTQIYTAVDDDQTRQARAMLPRPRAVPA